MAWMKLLGIALVAASCCAAGAVKALCCRERLLALEQARAALATLTQRLEFTLAAPAELLDELASDSRFGGCGWIGRAAELSQRLGFEEGWRLALCQSGFFEEGDIKLISAAGQLLGKSDLETQKRQLELISEQLLALTASAREECGKKERLYYALGSLSGLAAAVMLL